MPGLHDALFRATFGKPENMITEPRRVLPTPLVAKVDFATLETPPGPFVVATQEPDHPIEADSKGLVRRAQARSAAGGRSHGTNVDTTYILYTFVLMALSRFPLPSTFTYAQALDAGLTKHALYRLRDQGRIELLSRGLYRRTDREVRDLELLEIARALCA